MANPFSPEDVGRLAAALPPDGANPIGITARSVLVNKVKGQTPGRHSGFPVSGKLFREIFFPSYAADSWEHLIPQYTGLQDTFFSSLSVATLCEAMYNLTSNLRPQMLIEKIRGDLDSWDKTLRSVTAKWYAFMATVVNSDIRIALSAFPDESSRATALKYYREGLTSETWINDKVTQLNTGFWTNREWELFHHWIKLLALGATDQVIDETITNAISKGLPVPDEVGPGKWRQWSYWFGSRIGASDIGEAANPILETICHGFPGSSLPSCMKEENSYEFTANSQPGNPYRQLPSGSCFGPGTKVVMADGSLRNIEEVRANENIMTSTGPRKVILVATPERGGRELFHFEGTNFKFTADRPFLTYPMNNIAGTYAAHNAEALARSIPSLAQFGIQPLSQPGLKLGRNANGQVQPYVPPAVQPDLGEKPNTLYDLFIDPGEDGVCEYFAGDNSVQVSVCSEVPRYQSAPETTAVILYVLENAGPGMLKAMENVPDSGFADLLAIGLDAMSRTLIPHVGAELNQRVATTELPTEPLLQEKLINHIRNFAASFHDYETQTYNKRLGLLFDFFVTRFAPQFQAAIRLGWRTLSPVSSEEATLLAVTPYALEIFGDDPGIKPEQAMILLELSMENARYIRTVRVMPSSISDRFYYTSDEVIYFPEWRVVYDSEAPTRQKWQLSISLSSEDKTISSPYAAIIILPSMITHGYEAISAPIINQNGIVCGRALFDVRALDAEGFARDLREKEAWTQQKEQIFARGLSELASVYLDQAFVSALLVFQKSAVTRSGVVACLADRV